EEVQGRNEDGERGLFQRGDEASRRDDLGGRNRQRDRSARVDRPPHLAARLDRDSSARRRSERARLGPLARSGGKAAVHSRWTRVPYPVAGLLSTIQLAVPLGLWCRAAKLNGRP